MTCRLRVSNVLTFWSNQEQGVLVVSLFSSKFPRYVHFFTAHPPFRNVRHEHNYHCFFLRTISDSLLCMCCEKKETLGWIRNHQKPNPSQCIGQAPMFVSPLLPSNLNKERGDKTGMFGGMNSSYPRHNKHAQKKGNEACVAITNGLWRWKLL